MKLNKDIVYGAKGLVFKLVRKGEDVIFVDGEGNEIDIDSLSPHAQKVLMKANSLDNTLKETKDDENETPDPETPDPETPDPETPDPETPDPETPDPETPDPEVILEYAEVEAGVDSEGNLFLVVQHLGEAEGVKIHHSYDNWLSPEGTPELYFPEGEMLPWFKLYADPANVWGNAQSEQEAQQFGVTATYTEDVDCGAWTFKILDGSPVKQAIETIGREMVFHPRLVDLDGGELQAVQASTGFPA